MTDDIYRLDLWRFGDFKIQTFEVVKRTEKTIVVKMYHAPGRKSDGYYKSRYSIISKDHAFYDTEKEANFAAENVIVNRMEYYRGQADRLLERLKEVCSHKAIDVKGKCIRCDIYVANPDDYSNGGG